MKELRIALVCYGGLSLAVYMHGITKEILKLVRASRIVASHPEVRKRRNYDELNDDLERETDTERVYYELLSKIALTQELRVVVDVIAGTSAGGLNGLLLARALAHDLPLDSHRELWLDGADVTQLMEEGATAKPWYSVYSRPISWLLTRGMHEIEDEVRDKVKLLSQSRLLQPPFSGDRMTGRLIDGLLAMGSSDSGRSLLPPGRPLSVHITVTHLAGYPRAIAIDSPPHVWELEHRHLVSLNYRQRVGGEHVSDFDDDAVPALAFAARATSSYAGLFPAMTVAEVERVLAARGMEWSQRDQFVGDQFQTLIDAGIDVVTTEFIDGGVLNNKPFGAAISAIRQRTANRQVERRMLFLEPVPKTAEVPELERGYLALIRRALVEIPRHEPIRDDLENLSLDNQRVREFRGVIDSIRPQVRGYVDSVLANDPIVDAPVGDDVGRWRNACDALALEAGGYAYTGYCALRLGALAKMLADEEPALSARLQRLLREWAPRQPLAGSVPDAETHAAGSAGEGQDRPAVAPALAALDVHFRVRRARFLITRLNDLYTIGGSAHVGALDSQKQQLYLHMEMLADLQEVLQAAAHDGEPADAADALSMLARQLDLQRLDTELDVAVADAASALDGELRTEFLLAYLGFPFFDALSYPVTHWKDIQEVREIKVVRMSPEDANTLRDGGTEGVLKGARLNAFGGFFSRRYRENDYLWGRLHGADRLVDVVMSAAPAHLPDDAVDVPAIKRALFAAILKAEEPHLTHSEELLAELVREVSAL